MQNQWRQNQPQQSNVQSTQPKASVANNNPQNSQAKQENNSPSALAVNNNIIILSRGRILTITGGIAWNMKIIVKGETTFEESI
jgi:hypothetical protein